MKIGLIDVDGHNFPNLALMKISAYHKSLGDSVEWVSLGNYDRTYISKVFSFTPDLSASFLGNLGEVYIGGTGYNYDKLTDCVDCMCPDYSIYPSFKSAYGFLTRGCTNKCSWCIVPEKEGSIRPYADISDFLAGRKTAILMDNNVLAHDHGIRQIEKIITLGIRIDFNQGLDSRLIDRPMAKLLSRVKWLSPVRMSCDTIAMIKPVKRAVRYLREYDCKPYDYSVYVLVKDIESALVRVNLLKKIGCDPFAQPYIDFRDPKHNVTKQQKRFARWVNFKPAFKSTSFDKYN